MKIFILFVFFFLFMSLVFMTSSVQRENEWSYQYALKQYSINSVVVSNKFLSHGFNNVKILNKHINELLEALRLTCVYPTVQRPEF